MVVESFAIISILVVMVIIFYRTQRDHAIAVVPLVIPPAVNVIAYYLSDEVSAMLPFDRFASYCIIILLSVIISSFLIGIWSFRFKKKPTRNTYIVMCLLYNICFAGILVYNMYYQFEYKG